MVSRRRFLLAAGLGALGARPAAFAQSRGKIARVGFITGISRPELFDASVLGGFLQGMRERGHVEGKTFLMEWRFAEGKFERFPEFARELVALKADVVVVGNTPAAHAMQSITKTVPIVLGATGDPVGSGLVTSLARPGGNITGLSQNLADIAPKSLELLKAVLPSLTRLAVLGNPANQSNGPILKSYQNSAPQIGLQVRSVEAQAAADIEHALAGMAADKIGAVIVISDAMFFQNRKLIVETALKQRLPTLVQQREYVELGGLLSYGQSLRELFRRAASYVDRILKGAKPGDLPIEQPNVFELVVNLKTARTLGLKIPPSILARADSVIE